MEQQQRSIFITVVAWIFIIFSGMGLLEFVMFGFMSFDKLFPNGQIPTEPNQPSMAAMTAVWHVMAWVGGIISAWVLASSIGLLLRKNWARISYIVMMILGIGFAAMYTLFGVLVMILAGHLPRNAGTPPEMHAFMPVIMGFVVFISLLFLALYTWILIKLLSDKVRQEFKPAQKEEAQ